MEPRTRRRPSHLTLVPPAPEVFVPAPRERSVGAQTTLDYAWATYRRIHARGALSYRQPLSGAERGCALKLLLVRRGARQKLDCEEWLETLHLDGWPIISMWLGRTVQTPAPDGHVCDCTCEGGPGHARWEQQPPGWRPVNVFELLSRLACGDTVRVLLAPEAP
jgi:hypothetical protein